MPISIGVFDHMDRGQAPLRRFFQERLDLLEFADGLNCFNAYLLAEHHGTSLSTAPSPTVFLSAAAQRTEKLRLGALSWVLPIYDPLRLYEELCMLDQMSNGRYQLGVGRGNEKRRVQFACNQCLRGGLASGFHQCGVAGTDLIGGELELRRSHDGDTAGVGVIVQSQGVGNRP